MRARPGTQSGLFGGDRSAGSQTVRRPEVNPQCTFHTHNHRATRPLPNSPHDTHLSIPISSSVNSLYELYELTRKATAFDGRCEQSGH